MSDSPGLGTEGVVYWKWPSRFVERCPRCGTENVIDLGLDYRSYRMLSLVTQRAVHAGGSHMAGLAAGVPTQEQFHNRSDSPWVDAMVDAIAGGEPIAQQLHTSTRIAAPAAHRKALQPYLLKPVTPISGGGPRAVRRFEVLDRGFVGRGFPETVRFHRDVAVDA